MSHPISLQTYTVRKELKEDFLGTLKKVADMGYAALEASPGKMDPREFKKMLDDWGMRLSSTWARPTKDNVNQIVDQAKFFGYDCIVAGYNPEDFATLDKTRATADALGAMAELLKPHGLRLCIHNHWWEFETIEGNLAYDELMSRAGNCDGELDLYWASNFGKVNVPDKVAQYMHRLPLLHVKDGPLVKGQPHVALGQGKMDIPACINAADPGVLQYLVVELDDCATDMLTAVKESYEYLTRTGLGHGSK